MAQVDAFLKLDGIKGESADGSHKDEIEILNWSWGNTNTGTAHIAKGAGSGKVQVGDIHIHKRADISSPLLLKFCTLGQHIATGLLTVRKAGGNKPLEYFKIELKDILISSIQTTSSPGSPELFEDVTLNFGYYKQTYTAQNKDGSGGKSVDFAFDIPANKPG